MKSNKLALTYIFTIIFFTLNCSPGILEDTKTLESIKSNNIVINPEDILIEFETTTDVANQISILTITNSQIAEYRYGDDSNPRIIQAELSEEKIQFYKDLMIESNFSSFENEYFQYELSEGMMNKITYYFEGDSKTVIHQTGMFSDYGSTPPESFYTIRIELNKLRMELSALAIGH